MSNGQQFETNLSIHVYFKRNRPGNTDGEKALVEMMNRLSFLSYSTSPLYAALLPIS